MQSISDCTLLFSSSSPPATPTLTVDTTSEIDSDLEEVVLMPFSLDSPTKGSDADTTVTSANSKLTDLFDATTRPCSVASTLSLSAAVPSGLVFDNLFTSSRSVSAILAILDDIDSDEASDLHRLSLLATMPCTHFADFVPARFGPEKTSAPRPFLTGVDHPRAAPATKATVVFGPF